MVLLARELERIQQSFETPTAGDIRSLMVLHVHIYMTDLN